MSRLFKREMAVSRILGNWPVIAALTLGLGTVVETQVVLRSNVQRDTRPTHYERRIPVGTSAITGSVTASDTGASIEGARVTLTGHATCTGTGPGGIPDVILLTRIVTTDAGGQFAFHRLPAGMFKIFVAPPDPHLAVNYGQRRTDGEGQFIALSDGQQMALQVPVSRGAVITGQVVGPNGAPLRGVEVRALRWDTSAGFRRLQLGERADTDDRGVYRIFGLTPGTYFVAATPNAGYDVRSRFADAEHVERTIMSARIIHAPAGTRPATVSIAAAPDSGRAETSHYGDFLPTYAPHSLTPGDATAVTVGGNDERIVDIRVHLVRTSTIEGVVSTPLDAGVAVQLWIFNDDPSAEEASHLWARANQDGAFTFRDVAPGTYTVFAETVADFPSPRVVNGVLTTPPRLVLTDAHKMWGNSSVTVPGGPVVRMSVTLQPSRSISGMVVFDSPASPDLARIPVTVRANLAPSPRGFHFSNGSPHALVGPDGRFTISGVPGGRYVLELEGQFTLKSAVIAGQDTLDFPIDFTGDCDVTGAVLTVSDRAGEVKGTLTDSSGKPALDYVIVIAATDHRYWGLESRRVKKTDPDPRGRFAFDGLPAGSYQLSVVIDPEPGALSSHEFLRTIALTSIPVTIADGATVTHHLRVR